MSVPTAELTAPAVAPDRGAAAAAVARQLHGGRLYLWLAAAAIAVGALSLLIPSTPSYDPWAWLVWGREIIHVNLQTTGGPSWKPLPMIFTTLFAVFGKAQPDLWLIIARAGAVMAVVMVFKMTMRFTRQLLGGAPEESAGERSAILVPALAGSVLAAASFAVSRGFISDNGLGYSEGLMTALVLIAIDRHLDGARRQAFIVGFAAALDRPELWPFFGVYGLYLWRSDRGARALVACLFALIPALWFLPELWGSGHLFRGVSRANHPRSNSAAFARCPVCTEFTKHAWAAVLVRVKAVAILAMAFAALGLWRARAGWWRGLRRRSLDAAEPRVRGRLGLIACGALGFIWWLGISIETQLHFSGNDRYLVLGAALVTIAGGIGWGWLAHSAAAVLRRLAGPWLAQSGHDRRVQIVRGSAWAAALGAAVVFVALPPWLGASVPRTHRALVYQAHLREDMAKAVSDLGGSAKILRCGTVMTEGFQVPMLAWNLGVHTLVVVASPLTDAQPGPPPNVIFQTRAQRNASLLPRLRDWPGVHYTRVARVRTFRVYASCRGNVTL